MDNQLKRIVAVHDISGIGKCSLTVALPVISAAGLECSCIPTALLSSHTGDFSGFTFLDLSDQMIPIADHWVREGVKVDGIYSGYLASPEQEKLLEGIIERLAGRDTLIIVDPVMADHGEYYRNFDFRMCEAFKRLCARADVITPNITEAAFLTGMEYLPPPHNQEYIGRLLTSLAGLGPRFAALTGVQPEPNSIGVAAEDCVTGERFFSSRPSKPGILYGTGDLFAAAFSSLIVQGAPLKDSLEAAISLVADSIERSVRQGIPRRFGVDFENALPGFIQNVARITGK